MNDFGKPKPLLTQWLDNKLSQGLDSTELKDLAELLILSNEQLGNIVRLLQPEQFDKSTSERILISGTTAGIGQVQLVTERQGYVIQLLNLSVRATASKTGTFFENKGGSGLTASRPFLPFSLIAGVELVHHYNLGDKFFLLPGYGLALFSDAAVSWYVHGYFVPDVTNITKSLSTANANFL